MISFEAKQTAIRLQDVVVQVEISAQVRDAEARTKAVEAYAAVVGRLHGTGAVCVSDWTCTALDLGSCKTNPTSMASYTAGAGL